MKEMCRTERLILREFVLDDVDVLIDILGNPEAMRFSLGTKSRDEIVEWVKWRIWASGCNLPAQYAVVCKQASTFIGFCGPIPFEDPEGEAEHEMAFRYKPEFWNKGIGTEALQSCLDLAFLRFDLPAVLAVVEEANVGSVRVLEKAGLRYVRDTFYHDIPVKKYVMKKEDHQRMHAETISKSARHAASDSSEA